MNSGVATEHWCSSGFANTDLDLQLKKHGIHQLIVIGLIAHTPPIGGRSARDGRAGGMNVNVGRRIAAGVSRKVRRRPSSDWQKASCCFGISASIRA
jgi:nicotinamidase-related amidase